MTVAVRYLDPEPNGMASMLGGLIEGNLQAHPERERFVTGGRPATFVVAAPEVGAAVSIRFGPDGVRVRNGEVRRPKVRIEADSATLIGMSSVPLRFGLPDATTAEGREVLRKMLARKLRVRGAVVNGRMLARLNAVLSVASPGDGGRES